MSYPATGSPAPDFVLQDQHGQQVTLRQFRGRPVILYFYPKAMTPGCTVQACGLRDSKAALDALDVVVLGVSPDPVARLQKFAERDLLNFTLLSDPDHLVAGNYGSWGLKKFMGREYMGVLRNTFVIDKDGMVRAVMDKVATKTHHEDVLTWIRDNL
jgi:thioredoxin-dependent peroxiredoxin